MNAPTTRTAVKATAITMGLHTLCTVAMMIPALLAPVAAADFGTDASRVGVLVALIYVGVVPAGLACGLILDRIGDLRAVQLSGWLCALALVLAALAGWIALYAGGPGIAHSLPVAVLLVVLMFIAAVAHGMGYGMLNPLGSQILIRATPPEIISFIFSVKQSAVPIGQMLAGLIVPSLLLVVGWQVVVLVVAVMVGLYCMAIPWMGLDAPVHVAAPRPANWRIALASFLEPARTTWSTSAYREMALVGMLYGANQLCMLSFLVSYLNLEIGVSLVAAGTLFSMAQAGAMIGRLAWGFAADRWVTPRIQVGILGIVGGICGVITAGFSPGWPMAVIALVSLVYGATAVAWNGVFFAEIARRCPRDQVGRTTGGMQVYMSLGSGLGPLLFSGLVALTGSYAPGFAVFALPALLMGVRLVLRRER